MNAAPVDPLAAGLVMVDRKHRGAGSVLDGRSTTWNGSCRNTDVPQHARPRS